MTSAASRGSVFTPASKKPAVCIDCGCANVRALGRCSHDYPSAGLTPAEARAVDGLPQSVLYRCAQCDLGFRHPAPGEQDIRQLYEELPGARWSHDLERTMSWSLALSWLRRRHS